MYKYQFEFENTLNNDFPYVSSKKRNLSYDIPHYHSELEIIYVTDGSLTAIADNEKYTVEDDEFFIFMPGVVHSFNKAQTNSYYYAKILPAQVPGGADFSSLRPLCCAIKHGSILHEKLLSVITNLFRENEDMQHGYEFAILRYANEIAEKLLRHGRLNVITKDEQTKVAAKLEFMKSVNTFIEENYHEKIELEDAARACGYSKFYFAHFFKESTQISFYSYVTAYRLERAVYMMRTSDKSITQIAHECGFGSVRSFDRAFKKYYSVSPTEFLKTQI